MDNDFQVKIGDFEGPLGLLLNLIERRKMHISQVSLAQIADDYVNFLKSQEKGSMEEMANFILVASTLMLIKSLALLPGLQLTEEETTSVAELEERLKRLQRIRELSGQIKDRFGKNLIFLPARPRASAFAKASSDRHLRSGGGKVFAPTEEIKPANLLATIKNLLKNLPKPEIIPEKIIKKVISLEEVIGDLAKRVSNAMRMSFSEFVKDKKDKVNVIVSFLGMLELVKQGAIEIEQQAHFADIKMETKAVGVPHY